MKIYKVILGLYLILMGYNCFPQTNDNGFAIAFLIINVLLPSEEIKRQCAQPNAIYWGTINTILVSGGCINSKVPSGLIFDVEANQNITSETLTSGKQFKCLCNGKMRTDGFIWRRSKDVFDSIPQPPPDMEFIYAADSNSKTTDMNYTLTNSIYKSNDNLFCITKCNIGTATYLYQYQFLKIRNPQ